MRTASVVSGPELVVFAKTPEKRGSALNHAEKPYNKNH